MRWSSRYSSSKKASASGLGTTPGCSTTAARRLRTSPPAQKALSVDDNSTTQAIASSLAQRTSAPSMARIMSRFKACRDFGASSVITPNFMPPGQARSSILTVSTIGPLRRTFFQEGQYALFLVLRIEQAQEQGAFVRQGLRQWLAARALDQGLARRHATRALARHLGRQRQRGRQALAGGHHFFDQADGQGFGRIDTLAAQDHALGPD